MDFARPKIRNITLFLFPKPISRPADINFLTEFTYYHRLKQEQGILTDITAGDRSIKKALIPLREDLMSNTYTILKIMIIETKHYDNNLH